MVGFMPDADVLGRVSTEEVAQRLRVVTDRSHVEHWLAVDLRRLRERHVPVEVLGELNLGSESGFQRPAVCRSQHEGRRRSPKRQRGGRGMSHARPLLAFPGPVVWARSRATACQQPNHPTHYFAAVCEGGLPAGAPEHDRLQLPPTRRQFWRHGPPILSVPPRTVTAMSRVLSDHGSLEERTHPSPPPCPRHVLVQHDGTWVPGLLLEWVKEDAGWSGRAAWAHGSPVGLTVGLVAADSLRPT